MTLETDVEYIQADERRLRQMLVHLLQNAIKFTPEHGQAGLSVTSDLTQQTMSFTIWDTGIGIAPADMGRLFQPFVQLDSRLARQYGGAGLGLALVARLSRLHGGDVLVESVVGQGSRFILTLPLQQAQQER
jgi:signal transduction histidine kinase